MNVEMFSIRLATVDDVQTLVDFNMAMALETEQRRLDHHQLRAGVLALLAHPQYGFYIMAETPGDEICTVVGQLMITFEWSDWRNGVFWWVQSVYVRPEWRRRGVYRVMHEHVVKEAKGDPQVCGIRLYVEQRNHGAQTVYQRVGLTPSGYALFEQDFILPTRASHRP